MQGDWLFLDLDVIVTASIDVFFDYEPQVLFIVMQNWIQPGKGIGNTSVFRFRVGAHPYIYDRLAPEFAEIYRQFRIEQTYISRTVSEMKFWPDDWCVLFKTHCVPPMPQQWWKSPVLPATARVVAFPGVPNQHKEVQELWPVKKWYKKIYKNIRPASWIDDYWKA